MNIKTAKELLKILEKHDNINADEIASLLSISSSNVKKYISELKSDLRLNGANILSKSGRGNGYHLEITEEDKYKTFLNVKLQDEIEMEKESFLQKEKRIFFLATRLLLAEDYVLSQDLADEEAISLSQFSKELKEVKEKLSFLGVTLLSVPHHGLKVFGPEQAIRSALSYYLLLNENDPVGVKDISENVSKNSMIYKIRQVLLEVFAYYQYPYDALTLNNILVHLLVMCKRLKAGNVFVIDDSDMRTTWEYPIAVAVAFGIQKMLDIDVPDSEVAYIAMHLITKEISDDVSAYQDIKEQIDSSLKRIHEDLGYDLEKDNVLKNMLLAHTIPMLERAKYNTTFGVVEKTTIKEKFLAAESCAITYIDQMNKYYDIHLPYDEVWYCTLHFDVALKRKYYSNKKALVVTGVSRSNAIHIRSQLSMYFNEKCIQFDYVDLSDLKKMDLSKYDVILSAVQGLKLNSKLPIYYIPYFLSKGDLEMIKDIIFEKSNTTSLKTYFPEDFMIVDEKSEDKKSAMTFLSHFLKDKNLPSTFAKDVLDRDGVRKYTHGKRISLIQSIKNYECKPSIYINVLKNPVLWDGHMFDILLTVCCSKEDVEGTLQQLKLVESMLNSDELSVELEKNPDPSVVLDWVERNRKKKKRITQVYKIS